MTHLDSILKIRDITQTAKVHLVKAMVFPVVIYGCESWTIKKAEHRRIDGFELWCWRRLLRVPWTARRSNQSILKESSLEYSLEGLMLKLKLQYFGYLMQRTDSFEKTMMLGKIEGRRRGWQKMRWLDGITDSMDMSLSKTPGVGDGQGGLVCCSPWGHKESDTTKQLNWTDLMSFESVMPCNHLILCCSRLLLPSIFSRYLLTSYFCIPIPYDGKHIFLALAVSSVLEIREGVDLGLVRKDRSSCANMRRERWREMMLFSSISVFTYISLSSLLHPGLHILLTPPHC